MCAQSSGSVLGFADHSPSRVSVERPAFHDEDGAGIVWGRRHESSCRTQVRRRQTRSWTELIWIWVAEAFVDKERVDWLYAMRNEFPFPAGPSGQPSEEFARRRRDDPLGSVRLPSGDTARLATRYADVVALLNDPRFSSDPSREGAPRLYPGLNPTPGDRKSTRLNSSHSKQSRMPSSA